MPDTYEAIRRVMSVSPMWVSLFRFYKRTSPHPEAQLANRMRDTYRLELPEADWGAVAGKLIGSI